jgi:hypothetical protein
VETGWCELGQCYLQERSASAESAKPEEICQEIETPIAIVVTLPNGIIVQSKSQF